MPPARPPAITAATPRVCLRLRPPHIALPTTVSCLLLRLVTHHHPTPPLPPPQLKKLYADSREDMEASRFVPATSFNCDSREPEKWSFYLRRMLGGGGGMGGPWPAAPQRRRQQEPLPPLS